MIVPCRQRRTAWLIPVAAGLSFLLPPSAHGQEPVKQAEIKVVVRISRQLIEDVVAREEVVAAIPYCANVLGFAAEGVIDGRGTLTVDMTSVEGDGIFVVNGQGT